MNRVKTIRKKNEADTNLDIWVVGELEESWQPKTSFQIQLLHLILSNIRNRYYSHFTDIKLS